jgi:hypothetical protein
MGHTRGIMLDWVYRIWSWLDFPYVGQVRRFTHKDSISLYGMPNNDIICHLNNRKRNKTCT